MRTKRNESRTVLAALAVAALLAAGAAPRPALAGEAGQTGQAGSEFGLGVASVLANVFYAPVKVTYAVLGGVTGTLAYGLTGGNRQVADDIWVPSLGGDYVLGPDMLSGAEPIHFSGLRDTDAAPAAAPAATDAAAPGTADGFETEPAGAGGYPLP